MIECICSIMKRTTKDTTKFISVMNVEPYREMFKASTLAEAHNRQTAVIMHLDKLEKLKRELIDTMT